MIGIGSKNKKKQQGKEHNSQNSNRRLHPFTGIGSSLSINGNVRGNEDLHIDGKVKGTIIIDNHTLTIGPNGQIEADLQAKNIIVKGHVKGNIQASEKVYIQEAAQVFGDIIAADISVMDGARFEGTAKIQKSPQDITSVTEPTERKPKSLSLIEDEFVED